MPALDEKSILERWDKEVWGSQSPEIQGGGGWNWQRAPIPLQDEYFGEMIQDEMFGISMSTGCENKYELNYTFQYWGNRNDPF